MMLQLIDSLLNQEVFSGLLVLTGIFLLIKQRHLHPSMCLLFFILGYFSTQIPLVSGWTITEAEKFTAQGLISFCMIAVYMMGNIKPLLLVACLNELILIAVNIAFMLVSIHPWIHWAIFSAINYISFLCLLYHWRRTDIATRGSRALGRIAQTDSYVVGRHGNDGPQVPAMAKAEK